MARRTVTLSQVALVAGVSRSTAANVMSGRGRVSAATAARVRRAATAMGYRYHGGARALRTGGTPVVGFIVDIDSADLASPTPALWWPRTLFTCLGDLAARGYAGVVLPMDQPDALSDMRLDALVTVERTGGDHVLPQGLGFGIPVFYGGASDAPDANGATSDAAGTVDTDEIPRVAPDYPAILSDALNHMTDRGAVKPALLGLTHRLSVRDHTERAYRGWCADRGVEPTTAGADGEDLHTQVSSVVANGCDAVYSLAVDSPEILRVFDAIGVTVGKQVLLCVQSEGVIEAQLRPTVTTMSLCGSRTGSLLAAAIIEAVEGGPIRGVTVPHELTVRASTIGPP